jgi:DNA-binding XRE family transcriptional regulator
MKCLYTGKDLVKKIIDYPVTNDNGDRVVVEGIVVYVDPDSQDQYFPDDSLQLIDAMRFTNFNGKVHADNVVWASRIGHYRKLFNLNQTQMANLMGYKNYTAITHLENLHKRADRTPTLTKFHELAMFFENLSRERSDGKQVLRLNFSDLFYICDVRESA